MINLKLFYLFVKAIYSFANDKKLIGLGTISLCVLLFVVLHLVGFLWILVADLLNLVAFLFCLIGNLNCKFEEKSYFCGKE